jgi:Zn-dependent protease
VGLGDEFLIAAVGPLTSLLVAALFWIVNVFARGALPRSLIGMFGYLAWVNLLLAAFNLVPGFPLDGGRLLRSLVWRATGSFRQATRIASLAGQAVGWLLVAGGVAFLLAGNLAGGIWFAFIGWFLVQAARASYQEHRAGVRAASPAHDDVRRPRRGPSGGSFEGDLRH